MRDKGGGSQKFLKFRGRHTSIDPEVSRGLVRVEVPPAAVVAVVADHEVPRPQPRVAVLVDAAAVEARRAVIHGSGVVEER